MTTKKGRLHLWGLESHTGESRCTRCGLLRRSYAEGKYLYVVRIIHDEYVLTPNRPDCPQQQKGEQGATEILEGRED